MRTRMFPLRCTVRGCGLPLRCDRAALRCAAGHAFDRAREGYWNLLQSHQRRSARPGDPGVALEARSRWIRQRHADGLIATVGSALDRLGLPRGAAVADLGSGEGTLTARLLEHRPVRACGVELAVAGARQAARRFPAITWVVANADRGLPFPDASIDLLLSVYGRRPGAEMRRVLVAPGRAVVVLPAQDDLIELREVVQGHGERRERVEDAVAELAPWFELLARETWCERKRFDPEALQDALAASYRGARRRERERLAEIQGLSVTLAAEVLTFVRLAPDRRRSGGPVGPGTRAKKRSALRGTRPGR